MRGDCHGSECFHADAHYLLAFWVVGKFDCVCLALALLPVQVGQYFQSLVFQHGDFLLVRHWLAAAL